MDLSADYANAPHIEGAADFPPRWLAAAEAFRAALGPRAELGLPYGGLARHRFDLFRPEGTARGLMVFIHGGYWLNFGRESWSHLAQGALEQGWACAMPSYTLAPAARIHQITAEMKAAVTAAAHLVQGPVVVSGHSAGGHLAARLACTDLNLSRVARVVPISPLSDLAPLMQTAMNADLKIDEAEAALESPVRLALRQGCEAHVWVGAQERPAFLWQAGILAQAWGCGLTVQDGRHHFDVIGDLADPGSALVAACLGLASG